MSDLFRVMPRLALLAAAVVVGSPCLGAPPPSTADEATPAPADICDQAEDCQRLFDGQTRDEPWSSRMEQELRSFFGERTQITVKAIECRESLCNVIAATRAPSIHPWAMAIEEMHTMPWYAQFYDDTGSSSGPPAVQISPGLWVPKPDGVVAVRWFLERRPRDVP